MLDGIRNYLSMESTGALMVSGEWGCGKTYHRESDNTEHLTAGRMESSEGFIIWY